MLAVCLIFHSERVNLWNTICGKNTIGYGFEGDYIRLSQKPNQVTSSHSLRFTLWRHTTCHDVTLYISLTETCVPNLQILNPLVKVDYVTEDLTEETIKQYSVVCITGIISSAFIWIFLIRSCDPLVSIQILVSLSLSLSSQTGVRRSMRRQTSYVEHTGLCS